MLWFMLWYMFVTFKQSKASCFPLFLAFLLSYKLTAADCIFMLNTQI